MPWKAMTRTAWLSLSLTYSRLFLTSYAKPEGKLSRAASARPSAKPASAPPVTVRTSLPHTVSPARTRWQGSKYRNGRAPGQNINDAHAVIQIGDKQPAIDVIQRQLLWESGQPLVSAGGAFVRRTHLNSAAVPAPSPWPASPRPATVATRCVVMSILRMRWLYESAYRST
jgi:hypothetical protein